MSGYPSYHQPSYGPPPGAYPQQGYYPYDTLPLLSDPGAVVSSY